MSALEVSQRFVALDESKKSDDYNFGSCLTIYAGKHSHD